MVSSTLYRSLLLFAVALISFGLVKSPMFGYDEITWRNGGGFRIGFGISKDRVPQVKGYIERQKIHHKTETVFEEYEKLLRAHGEKEIHEFMFNFLE